MQSVERFSAAQTAQNHDAVRGLPTCLDRGVSQCAPEEARHTGIRRLRRRRRNGGLSSRGQVVEDTVPGLADVPAGLVELTGDGALPTFRASDSKWAPTSDVHHPEHGHGWVQGSGHGVVSVRFESRSSGPGRGVSLAEDDPDLRECSPLCSLDWEDWFTEHDDAAEWADQPPKDVPAEQAAAGTTAESAESAGR